MPPGLGPGERVSALVCETPCLVILVGGGDCGVICEGTHETRSQAHRASQSQKQAFWVGELSEAAVRWIVGVS